MIEKWNSNNFGIKKEIIAPVKILASNLVGNPEELLNVKEPCVAFSCNHCAHFNKGSWVLLDFGKELCGSVRIITRDISNLGGCDNLRITFGESASEACSVIGEKNATNDHSPRDFTALVSPMSDLTFGLTGFRFVRIEMLDDKPLLMQNIYAVSILPDLAREAVIKTSDRALNKIINTAAYTLKLNFQNGYIWDGIKRDRLVWCGDLHQEVVTSLYLFGDTCNIPNSLDFLKNDDGEWINGIPSYSAWWVINLCDYCTHLGKDDYFAQNREHAEKIMAHFDECIDEDGTMRFGEGGLAFFIDWPTLSNESDDSMLGTAAIVMLAANKLLKLIDDQSCHNVLRKLSVHLNAESTNKQTRAFQILAGRKADGNADFLDKNGAAGFSTFMAYYILSAYVRAGGDKALELIKQYFGGMLSRGATTFWEDFNLEWLKGSSRIDCLPKRGQRDIHGDYGDFCYKGFRHSLCHGWSSGVLAFIIENIFGIQYEDGCRRIYISPSKDALNFKLKLPLPQGWLRVTRKSGVTTASAPKGVAVIIE